MTDGKIAGWGRIGLPGKELVSERLDDAQSSSAVLFRGLGRSYGDSSLPPASSPVVISTHLADRIRSFDPETGILRAEAGLSLHAMNKIFIPRGFFVPVTPGTAFVTLGGMVASDVHGKEHHVRGCFGEHVTRLLMQLADGRIVWCSDEEYGDLFRATIGGMGLTGHILEVEFKMMRISSPWISQYSKRVDNIEDYLDTLKTAAKEHPYTVGWIDCLTQGPKMGRGILMAGDWMPASEAPKNPPMELPAPRMPFDFPDFALKGPSVKAFNTAFYWKHLPREKQTTVSWGSFFYPLDIVHDWNRIYGKSGFTQYQCVLPENAKDGAARRVLDILTRMGGASFLCVIKDCGPQGKGLLSFPMKGISIALDIKRTAGTQALIDALNEQVIEEGGRIYLTKDQFTRPEHFLQMEKRLGAFQEVRRKYDPNLRFRSAQSVRLFGDPA